MDALRGLNVAQRKAVEYVGGPELVIAGAGSGKTRVLTCKIANLIRNGYDPGRIMALTFTNKAAREMKERIAGMVSPWEAAKIWAGTFHSIFLRILRSNSDLIGYGKDFTIYDQADSRSLLKMLVKELGLNEEQYRPAKVGAIISNAKNDLVSPAKFNDGKNDASMARLYSLYCERSRLAQAMDFDDILYYTNVLLRDNVEVRDMYADFFEYILVDEYQDTNFAQSLIVDQLASKHRALCVVGDDAQSIYSFRGANIRNILDIEKRWGDVRVFKLEQNYRSTQTIVNAAGSLIEKNRGQIPKRVFSEKAEGEKIEVVEANSDYEEAALVAGAITRRMRRSGSGADDVAVLYRTNSQSRQLEEALRRRNMPYRIYGGLTFYQRKEVKDAIAYFRLVVNPNDDEALRRVINYPARGIGETTMKKLRGAALQHSKSLWEVLREPLSYGLSMNKGTLGKLDSFVRIIDSLRSDDELFGDAYEMGKEVYNRSGLIKQFGQSKAPEEISKAENLDELLSGLKEFTDRKREQGYAADMATYLQEISLLTDQDINDGDSEKKITLMTIHAAKGLEFKHVFITGLEEGLFPTSQSFESSAAMEEERRLLYVAITRAEESCFMSYALSRFRNGMTEHTGPSRFLREIDSSYLQGNVVNSYASPQSLQAFGRRIAASSSSTPVSKPQVERMHAMRSVRQPIIQEPKGGVAGADISMLAEGMQVRHSRFGLGRVKKLLPGDLDMAMVEFDTFGEKKLILKFARLEIVG